MSKNMLLTAKQNVSSRTGGKDLKKGYSVVVASPSTAHEPEREAMIGAMILDGFSLEDAEQYYSSYYTYYFNAEVHSDYDSKLHNKQWDAYHKAKQADRDKKSNAAKETKKNKSDNDSKKNEKSSEEEKSGGFKETVFLKFILTIIPVLPILWIIKLPFKLVYATFVNLFNAIFCGCCSKGETSIWPSYSLMKF